jgi:putative aminopeptidase FrvX
MELLTKLTQADGVSGKEDAVREIIKREIEDYCDEISIDSIGSLIAHKKGSGKKIMFAAHMDEIGVIVTYIDEKGFIRFRNVGGLYIRQLVGRRVRFSNGVIGVIGSEEEEFNKKPSFDKLYIDIGAQNSDEAKQKISIGDTAAFIGEVYANDKIIVSKALDNRTGCYILIKAMQRLKNVTNDLYFVFTSQEEVGLRGAKTTAFSINPDYAVAVDVTDTGDTPEAPLMAINMGSGAAIKVMDRSVLCDSDVRIKMIETAKKHKIPYQLEIMTDGGTDAGAIHLTRSGIKTGGVSLPVRYVHSPSEMACIDDLQSCIDLISILAQDVW